MKFLTKVSAGFLLSIGLICTTITVGKFADLADANTSIPEKHQARSDAFSGVGMSTSFLAAGGWMLWGLRRKQQQQIRDRLDSTFYRILKADKGRVTVLRLAMEAQLPGQPVKKYLEEKAKEFNAAFEISEYGDISYCFNILPAGEKC
jgi:hypothetical protein